MSEGAPGQRVDEVARSWLVGAAPLAFGGLLVCVVQCTDSGEGTSRQEAGSSRPGLRECGGYCLSPLVKPWNPGQGPAGLEEWLWLLEPVLVTAVLLWRSWATLLRWEVEIRTFNSAPPDLIETSPGGLWAASPARVWKAGVV